MSIVPVIQKLVATGDPADEEALLRPGMLCRHHSGVQAGRFISARSRSGT